MLFIDEAYSLKQGPKDTYGQEAVDALIKEMEDKRESVIVILAGYQKEMQEFFKSNPGFTSRVPFSFHFADYTCGELESIGGQVLAKSQMEVDKEATRYMDNLWNPLVQETTFRSVTAHMYPDWLPLGEAEAMGHQLLGHEHQA